jgi:Bifunctional DNA primase/polymerase, N-terminal/Primase C terminal 1 (PriCT-1)
VTVASSSTNAPRAQCIFSRNQAVYAAHGVATFPLKDDKVSAIKHYFRVGLAGSAKLAQKFTDAPALGFIAGHKSKICVLDVDTTDETVLSDALARHGASPLIVRTGSGKFHAYYRHNGERRRIRPWRELPIDIIGGGVAVAPPSRVIKGDYKIIRGHIDDLDRLPVAKWLKEERQKSDYGDTNTGLVHEGRRNKTLWEHCMRNGKSCDSLADMEHVAHTFNKRCVPMLEDGEVMLTAKSAWSYTEHGMNRFGLHGVFFPDDEYTELLANDQYALLLLGFLRSHNGPCAEFLCTNTLAEKFGWPQTRLAAARCRLIELGYITRIRKAGRGHGAFFKWATKR